MATASPVLSIVIPCHNEEGNALGADPVQNGE